ncbi:putative protein kinase [Trypanosoma grayi]|uniref:putative protein kinase n=1 Tax=Trypanosoma grayi TaxID=71804 RepID=UPI0004F40D0C|nr:putative protein kinase [Trypanosoma grayi]KEG14178.1 putative protein kinase [Trypanosoma grayi]
MADSALALCGVFCGCQANVFLLELIAVKSSNIFYALTFAQYVVVALLSLPLVCVFTAAPHGRGWRPPRLRPMRLLMSHKVLLAVSAWVMSVSSNLVFGLYISVPLHATFRSSSLLLNMLAGYFFLEKRYTALQVLCAVTLSGGLVVLTVEKSWKLQDIDAAKGQSTPDEYFWWACGVVVLALSTAFSTGLGIFQEHMYEVARHHEEAEQKKEKLTMSSSSSATARAATVSPPPMWAEALFFSHLLAIPLFFLQPFRLLREFASISPESYTNFFLNTVTQYVCVAGVYVLNDKTSAFTLILTLTLRKLGTFVLSVVYFGHYRHFSGLEWGAMMAALAAGTVYPLLPKNQAVTSAIRRTAKHDKVA